MQPSPHIAHHFNSWTWAGAAIAAIRIARSLADNGCRISFWNQERESREPVKQWGGGTLYYAKPNRWRYAWQCRQHTKRFGNLPTHLQLSLPWHHEKPAFYPERYGDGVLHFHWTGDRFFDHETFFSSIPDNHPIVWTLHDLNPITGGCHYAGACRRFEKNCGNCPQLMTPSTNDITFRAMEVKLRILKGKNLHFVAPSHWMEAQIRASSIGKLAKSIQTIHYPLDTHAFSPLSDRAVARGILGIHHPVPIIAFGAVKADDPRKGLAYLVKALLKIKGKTSFQLLIFGLTPPKELAESGIPYHCVGHITHQPLLRAVYGAADLFVIPSLEETLGQVGIESLACGTPVIGFRAGGIPDFVEDGETGLLVETGNADDLAEKILVALGNPTGLEAMRKTARARVVERFEAKQQGIAYKALYERICS